MTWRAFLTYVRGLSPGSSTAAMLQVRRAPASRKVVEIRDPKQIDRAFAAFGSTPEAKV